ncbi:MAG: hypothetical protein ACK4UO_06290 [Pseudolabrys sp.]
MIAGLLRALGGLAAAGGLAAVPVLGPALAFLATPLGRAGAVLAVGVGLFALGFYKGDAHGDRQCDDLFAQAELAKAQIELARERSARAIEQQVLNDLQNRKVMDDAEISALREQVARLPEVDQCRFGNRAGGAAGGVRR